jgi:hypothetical protein
VTLRITRFLDCAHRPVIENTTFQKLNLFPSSSVSGNAYSVGSLWKEIYNKQHSASIAFPVNVAEATLAKQADLLPCDSMDIGTTSKKSSRKIQTVPTCL